MGVADATRKSLFALDNLRPSASRAEWRAAKRGCRQAHTLLQKDPSGDAGQQVAAMGYFGDALMHVVDDASRLTGENPSLRRITKSPASLRRMLRLRPLQAGLEIDVAIGCERA
jgi:hypothetical protein